MSCKYPHCDCSDGQHERCAAKEREKKMKLEAGKRYCTVGKYIVYIIGYDHTGSKVIGYVVRYTPDGNEVSTTIFHWYPNGKFFASSDAPDDYDITHEYVPPHSGEVALWVFYSPTLGYMYLTSEVDEEAIPAARLADMGNAVLVCRKIVEWSEENGR